jgi:ribonuclease R
MPRREELTDHDLLAHLSRAREPASLREIARALDLRHNARRDLHKIIGRLKRRGEVEEVRGGRFRLAGKKVTSPQPHAAARGTHASAPPRGSTPTSRLPAPLRKKSSGTIVGRFVAHRDGYGFVVPDEPVPGMEGDLFIGRDHAGDAMHGDRVEARIDRRGSGPRRAGRAEGAIIKVLKRAQATLVGVFHYGDRGNTVVPYESRILQPIIIPPGAELTPELRARPDLQQVHARRLKRLPELDGAVVNVELIRFPSAGVTPAGQVLEIIGRPGDFGVDVEIMIRKHRLPYVFPDEVLTQARTVGREVSAEDRAGREDFRHLPIVTIDGETARDFDDAVYVEPLAGGRWQLQVHIADVAYYVSRASPLDREARLRGTSVYFPNRAVPMLPEELSNGICSLNPQVDRLVMSAILEISADGAITASRFTNGVIRSAERMTYTNVNKVIEGDPEMSARYASLVPHFRNMRDLALILNKRRTARGSIDFDLPERVIEFDDVGRMVSIVRSERNIANRLIEEFMLAANQAVARYLEGRGIVSLHRVHEKPDPKKVLEFEQIAHSFGYSLGVADLAEKRVAVRHGRPHTAARSGRDARLREQHMTVALPSAIDLDIRPQHYQRLTAQIAGKPEERIVSYLMLRSLKQARYAVEPLGHFALAFDQYTHFTSPIRRYPDLIVHRTLKWALENPEAGAPAHKKPAANQDAPERGPYRRVELEEVAEESSEAERRSETAERELMDWKTAEFMEKHLGEEYDALITSVQKFGFFVELMEIFVEGLVPINILEELTGERCFYREQDHSIGTGRGKYSWGLGDRIRVRADRIDPMRRRVEFSPILD